MLCRSRIVLFACLSGLSLMLCTCGAEPQKPPGAVESFCTVGTVTCAGNYLAECVDEGKAYKLTFCGESKSCVDGANPSCKAVICAGGKGARTCSGDKVMQCEAAGTEEAYAAQTCSGSELCQAGECLPKDCNKGDKRCGWGTLLECDGGGWKASKCGPQQYCDVGKLACSDRMCTPTSVQCASKDTASTCSVGGDSWKDTKCAPGELCYDGVCHREVKGVDPSGGADAGPTDAGKPEDTTVTQKDVGLPSFQDIGTKDVKFDEDSSLSVILSETATPPPDAVPIEYEIMGATYLGNESMLQITGDMNLDKIEIQIAPVEEFQTGTFSALGGEAEKSAILANDGSELPGNLQWRFQSSDYSIKVTKFEDTDGRVIGTFTGEMKDALDKSKVWYLVDGKFSIIRK